MWKKAGKVEKLGNLVTPQMGKKRQKWGKNTLKLGVETQKWVWLPNKKRNPKQIKSYLNKRTRNVKILGGNGKNREKKKRNRRNKFAKGQICKNRQKSEKKTPKSGGGSKKWVQPPQNKEREQKKEGKQSQNKEKMPKIRKKNQ